MFLDSLFKTIMLNNAEYQCNVMFWMVCVITEAVPIYIYLFFFFNEANNAFLVLCEFKMLLYTKNKGDK